MNINSAKVECNLKEWSTLLLGDNGCLDVNSHSLVYGIEIFLDNL